MKINRLLFPLIFAASNAMASTSPVEHETVFSSSPVTHQHSSFSSQHILPLNSCREKARYFVTLFHNIKNKKKRSIKKFHALTSEETADLIISFQEFVVIKHLQEKQENLSRETVNLAIKIEKNASFLTLPYLDQHLAACISIKKEIQKVEPFLEKTESIRCLKQSIRMLEYQKLDFFFAPNTNIELEEIAN